MSALPAIPLTPARDPADELAMALEAICRVYGYRAAHVAAHAALKRVAEARRKELTAQGWVI